MLMPIRGKGDDDEIDSDGEESTNAGTEDSIDVVEEEDENGTGDDNNDEDEVHGSSFWLQKWYNDEDENVLDLEEVLDEEVQYILDEDNNQYEILDKTESDDSRMATVRRRHHSVNDHRIGHRNFLDHPPPSPLAPAPPHSISFPPLVDYISHQLDHASHQISIPYLSEDEFIQNQSRGFEMAQSRGVRVGMPQDIARRRAAAAADDDDSSSDTESMPELEWRESHLTDMQRGMAYKPIVSPSFSALTIVPDRINHEIILCVEDGQAVHDWLCQNDFETGDLRSEVWVEGVGEVCPMAFACYEGDIKKCKWLYENGAEEDITKRNERGETPMLLASMKAHLKICQWLYEMGAASDVITARKDGFHPTLFACANGCLPLCKWLFAVGAAGDVTRENVEQTTPMLLACGGGYLGMCKWLLTAGAGRDVSRPNTDGETPMLKACYNGHLHVCEWLLEQGAAGDICRPNTFGSTPLLWCCARGHLSLCRWLHENGAAKDIRTPDKHGMSPMLWACMKGHLSICKWLYEVGAAGDVAVTNVGGYTPMLRACWSNRSPVCQWLILNGALNNTITQHIDHAMVRSETREVTHHRESLFIWAQELLAARETFVSVVLCCRSEPSATAPSGDHESCEGTKSGNGVAAGGGGSSKSRRIGLSNIPAVVLERIASLVGIPTGRRLRNLREFKVAMQLLIAD